MSHHSSANVNALHRVVVGVCSAFILILAVGSLFVTGGMTEDPETHTPLDPRGAVIGIPIGIGGLVFSLAGVGFRRRRRHDDYRAIQTAQRVMPRVDRADHVAKQAPTGPQARIPREQQKVFWTTPPRGDDSRQRRDSD